MSLIQQARKKRRPVLAGLAVVFYLFTAAIVPPGHMAAALGSGTAFHLCPGDARSAFIIDALAAASKAASKHDHHNHHATHAPEHGDHGGGISETSADAGCIFAGAGIAIAGSLGSEGDNTPGTLALALPQPTAAYRSGAWLRPPVRSPPA
ncbi:hypothetical protein NOR53_3142 [gamma proteobacterium NOR5-3]|nr:hypothetical protein NOR53_3142 [gamma proteobacterium NOR5-3]